jgi:preprotein translocase subunit SecD
VTLVEHQLQELLHQAAPESAGVDFAEVSRLGRRLQRRRRAATTASAVIVSVVAGSLAAVIATSGHPQNATVRPLPVTDSSVTATLTPSSASATAADLHADAAVLTRRLAAAGIHGQVQTGTGSITLQLPASAAGSVAYLASTGQLSFRIPAAIEQAPTMPTTAAGSCLSAAGPASGNPPPCITARLSAGCPKPGTAEGRRVAAAPATDWIVACDTTGTVEYALAPQRLDGNAVASAQAAIQTGVNGTSTGQWIVNVNFTPTGQSEWTGLTDAISKGPGCPKGRSPAATPPVSCLLAIELDGVVQSAPVIQERIAGSAEITGSFTGQSAKALAAALSSGTLPMPLTVRRTPGSFRSPN